MAEKHIINIDSDSDEDEDLRRAIALSLEDPNGTTPSADVDGAGCTQAQDAAPEQAQKTHFGSMALDRKQMEAERLQRLAKRRRSSGEDAHSANRDEKSEPPTKKQLVSGPSGSKSLEFPRGTVKRTWARGYTKTSDDITIEEVFQKDELQLALLSSFQWDEEWMLSKIDFPRTKLMLLAFASTEEQKLQMRSNVPSNINFCFPPMHGPGSMHSKLQLLKYPHHLRIVVPTGNLVPYDWGETGVMENMLFIIDLPRQEATAGASRLSETNFSKDLCQFLSAASVDEKMINSLANYDFSATSDIGFVCTIPGSHTDQSRDRVGYCGLGRSVRELVLSSGEPSQFDVGFNVEVDAACASLGAINCDFVNAMYNACKGDDGMQEYNQRQTRKPAAVKDPRPSKQLRDNFRIYFPTAQTVTRSKGGTKVMFVRRRAGTPPASLQPDASRTGAAARSAPWSAQGWAYVGSANLSESAWGKMSKDKTTGKAKMTCRNWECGVVLVADGTATPSSQETGSMSIFSSIIPVPMDIPGRPYEDGDLPWFFSGDN